MAETKRISPQALMTQLQSMQELIITLPIDGLSNLKTKLSQTKHHMGIKDRLKFNPLPLQEGATVVSVHIVLGNGQELEYFDIKEVDSL